MTTTLDGMLTLPPLRRRGPEPRRSGLVTAFAVCLALTGSTRALTAQSAAAADPTIAAADRGRVLGSDAAKLWMLVVSDYQCPFCKQWHDSTWGAIQREFVATGKLRVAFLNFPLDMHRNARPAAIEAMCAAVQGKFWRVTDALFANQARWENLPNPRSFFDGLAKSAGLDVRAQQSCVGGTAVPSLVEADRIRMTRAGTTSTPTFYIGGSRIEGAQPTAVFRRVIAAELAGRRP